MLPDVGMVQMYSKSVNVNAIELTWVLHGQAGPLFAWTGPPPCSYVFSTKWFAMPSETHRTIPTSALDYGGNIFTHPYSYNYSATYIILTIYCTDKNFCTRKPHIKRCSAGDCTRTHVLCGYAQLLAQLFISKFL